jgi:HNH endonuclease
MPVQVTAYDLCALAILNLRKEAEGKLRSRFDRCTSPAPFLTTTGEPYLEPHHIRRLSDGGLDDPRWIAALCANCHRRAHHANDENKRVAGMSDAQIPLPRDPRPRNRSICDTESDITNEFLENFWLILHFPHGNCRVSTL